ncbi:uncharacterized protein [Periplaneta americana]|uniref:uncharacterized protein n=1 Tax=Periplaneta americana TaxID=6978 RepID=UPI0037E8DF98
MLLGKAFLAGLLVLCASPGFIKGENEETGTLPTLGFFKAIKDHMYGKFLDNRAKNNASLQEFNEIWEKSFGKLTQQVEGLAETLLKVQEAYNTLQSVKNGDIPLAQKAIQTAAATAALTTTAMGLLQDIQNVITSFSTSFARVPAIAMKTAIRNANFAQDMVTYIPKEIAKKTKDLINRVNGMLDTVRPQLTAGFQQLHIILLKLLISITKAEIPLQRFLTAVFDQLKIIQTKINIITTYLQIRITLIINMLNRMIRGQISMIQKVLQPMINALQIGEQTLMKNVRSVTDKMKSTLTSIAEHLGMNSAEPLTTTAATININVTMATPSQKL